MDEWFPVLHPPRGGLEQLRARLETRSRRLRWVASASAAGALLLAVLVVVLWPAPRPDHLEIPRDLQVLIDPPPNGVRGRGQTVVQQVDTGAGGVTFVRVWSLEAEGQSE